MNLAIKHKRRNRPLCRTSSVLRSHLVSIQTANSTFSIFMLGSCCCSSNLGILMIFFSENSCCFPNPNCSIYSTKYSKHNSFLRKRCSTAEWVSNLLEHGKRWGKNCGNFIRRQLKVNLFSNECVRISSVPQSIPLFRSSILLSPADPAPENSSSCSPFSYISALPIPLSVPACLKCRIYFISKRRYWTVSQERSPL